MNEHVKIILILFVIFFEFQLHGQSPVQDQDVDPAYLQSISHYESGRYQKAKMGFNQYLKLGKTNSFLVGSHFYLAQIEIEVNKNLEPMIQFANHYKVEALYMKALFSLGDYHFRLKDYKKAITYLYQIRADILVEHLYVKARFNLAYSLYMEKIFNKALPLFKEVTHYEQKDKINAHYYAGVIYFKNEEYDNALDQFLLAQNRPEMYKLTVPYVVKIYLNQKQYKEVIAYAETHLDNTKDINYKVKFF